MSAAANKARSSANDTLPWRVVWTLARTPEPTLAPPPLRPLTSRCVVPASPSASASAAPVATLSPALLLAKGSATSSAMKLYRAFATVGGLTMVSRLLGFIRDILIAAVLGTGAVADAFFVAFRFPNLFRRLFGEGAFNAAFVPLFAKKLEGTASPAENASAARHFAEEALAGLLFVLLILTALCEMAMPWLMYVLAPGFTSDPDKYDLAVLLTRITFPYLLAMSLVALLSGVLNSLGRFTAAAAAPILLNIVLVSVMLLAASQGLEGSAEAGIMLSWGVAVAGALQLFMLALATYRAGMGLGLRRPRLSEDVRQLIRLGIPGVISGGVTQINIVVGTMIASMQAGAVSFLYYADRLSQLPLGIVGIAIGVVLLPDLSRKLRAGEDAAAMDSQNRSLEFGLLLALPAAVALSVSAGPILTVLFERGAFTAADTAATAPALIATAVGLPAFILIKVFSPAFFAREDTRTPMRFAVISMIINIFASLALFFLFSQLGLLPHIGIAIAGTISGWVNALLLWGTLARNGNFELDARLLKRLPRIILASAIMGAALWATQGWLASYFEAGQSPLIKWSALTALVTAGLGVYGLAVLATGALPPRTVLAGIKRQSKGG